MRFERFQAVAGAVEETRSFEMRLRVRRTDRAARSSL